MKIIVAQLNYTVGDIRGNYQKILNEYLKFRNEQALLVFTELALTGYYPQDLLLRPAFLSEQWQALEKLKKETTNYPCGIVIGYAKRNVSSEGNSLLNALTLLSRGKEAFDYAKRLLPTYNVFDETRHFVPGADKNWFQFEGKKIGFLICEDAWYLENKNIYEEDPLVDLVGKELDCVISINASPSNLGKLQQRRCVAQRVAQSTSAPFLYANQVGANDELVFDGASFALNERGECIAQAKLFEEDRLIIDLAQKENQTAIDMVVKDEELQWKQVVLGIRDYVAKCGFSKVVIGSSGGIDSAVTLAICAEAVGAENVTAITMPSSFSSKGSVDDSKLLCEKLGVRLLELAIAEEFNLAVSQFKRLHGTDPNRITTENIQARIRGRILMEYSNHFGALVISTGNKSEMSVGYATLYGDMNGGVNPLGDLYKMEVYALAKYINTIKNDNIIPVTIIEKEPSAELSEGQQDSDSLPEYDLLDAILKLYIEGDLLSGNETEDCCKIIKSYRTPTNLVRKVQKMVDNAEFKRKQAPPIIRVQKRSFGMGRWLPVAAKYS